MWGRGTVLGGRYTLVERIGGGGMGEVWRADDGVLARQVAVKILLPSLLDDARFASRFKREARILAGLSHPGIVDVHDYGESETEPGTRTAYIVMELLDGRPLDAILAQRGPMPVDEALEVVAQALDALHAAHQRDVVHRDVKPSNLMVREDGRVTVTDFGIARPMAGTKITASHSILGTALYVSPEQVEARATTPVSDLYSIGVVCYEMLTGEPPFNGEAVLEVVLKHVREPAPELPAGFPRPVREFVARALAKQPEDRFADAAAMAAAARRAADGTSPEVPAAPVKGPRADPPIGGTATDVTPNGAAERPRRTRSRLLIPLVIPVVITAGGAGTFLLIDRSPHQPPAAGAQPTGTVATSASLSSPGSPAPAPTPSPTPTPEASAPSTPQSPARTASSAPVTSRVATPPATPPATKPTTPAPTAPRTPSNLTLTVPDWFGVATMNLTWDRQPDNKQFELYFTIDDNNPSDVFLDASKASYTINSIPAGSTVCVKLRAVNDVGNSSWSSACKKV